MLPRLQSPLCLHASGVPYAPPRGSLWDNKGHTPVGQVMVGTEFAPQRRLWSLSIPMSLATPPSIGGTVRRTLFFTGLSKKICSRSIARWKMNMKMVLPKFIKKEFDEFLKCGILSHGFLRTQCQSCHHERLVAFSCKRRGFCPSCGARRMAESAAHLADEVFPKKPLRQWVSFPFQMRFLFAKDPKVMGEVLTIVHRAISTYLIKKVGLTKKSGAKTGSVTFIQRFGGSLNLNIHFHMMCLDGVYTFHEGKTHFHSITPPTQDEIDSLLLSIAHKVVRHLEKKGVARKR